jgi:hypothetical protein
MGMTYPPAYFGMAMAQASLIGPAYVGLAWQAAWLDLLAQAAREAEKAQGKS